MGLYCSKQLETTFNQFGKKNRCISPLSRSTDMVGAHQNLNGSLRSTYLPNLNPRISPPTTSI